MKPNMKFFDKHFCMTTKRDKGLSIWDVDSSYLKWMLDKGREGMGPLEVDIIRSFLTEKKRVHELIKTKHERKEAAQEQVEDQIAVHYGVGDDTPPLSDEEKEIFDAIFA